MNRNKIWKKLLFFHSTVTVITWVISSQAGNKIIPVTTVNRVEFNNSIIYLYTSYEEIYSVIS
jgi:hypothetical protein